MSPNIERSRRVELEEFVEGRYGWLLRVAFRLTGDRHEAEDLLQDALVRSWAERPGHGSSSREPSFRATAP